MYQWLTFVCKKRKNRSQNENLLSKKGHISAISDLLKKMLSKSLRVTNELKRVNIKNNFDPWVG